ncbi:MAG: hypothetical protein CSA65_07270 [Proteobacteria bacterium]|nr:MAG: hypothetical protein CSB49_02200 [Pseudomonadota bacterium]PIE17815.1 MAG: hypothetical protein CSA65_07270 [Pseudomonadota bacterium]
MSKTRYELLNRIAIGGTAEVFRAQAVVAGERRKVVLKRVLPQLARDERFRRLFADEARFAAALEHPNIVRILDFGELDGTCFLALEEIEGHDLSRLLAFSAEAGQRVPAPLAALIVARVARALAFAHEQVSAEGVPLQIIHRDVSPQNILVSFQGDVKLTDFGIAESALAAGDAPQPQGVRGKPAYMAPEQADSRPLDHRSDLFALGCVLYELLGGAPPFAADNDAETLRRLRSFLPRPKVLSLEAPTPLRGALDQLLRRLPRERLQHADALIAKLEPYLAECGEAATEAALGRWARELDQEASAQPDVNTPAAMVDDAVRALLGDPQLDSSEETLGLDAPQDGRPRTSTQQVPTSLPSPVADVPQRDAAPEPSAPEPLPQRKRIRTARSVAPASAITIAGLAPKEPPTYTPEEPARGEGTAKVRRAAPPRQRSPLPWLIAAVAVLVAGGVVVWALLRSPTTDRHIYVAPRMDAGRRHVADSATPRRSATIRIESLPTGAKVRLDGEARGSTPLSLRLPGKAAVLTLSKPSYHTRTLRLSKRPQSPVVVKLRRRLRGVSRKRGGVGFLTINSLPWSKVYVDGRYLGNTPLVSRHLRAGRRRLLLKDGRGRVRKRLRVQIIAGKRHRFSFDLR